MPDKYRGRCLQATIRLNTGSPMEELEKGLKELKGFATPLSFFNVKIISMTHTIWLYNIGNIISFMLIFN